MKTDNFKHKNNTGFKVPETYFQDLENSLMNKISHDNELPIVESSGFMTPDSYFDELEDSILAKSIAPETKVVPLFKKEYWLYASAIAAIMVIMLGNFFPSNQTNDLGWDDIEVTALENYIYDSYEMGSIDLNSVEYSDLITQGDLEADFTEIDTEAAFEYIDENVEDPSYIMD